MANRIEANTPNEVALARQAFEDGGELVRSTLNNSVRGWAVSAHVVSAAARTRYPSIRTQVHRTFEWESPQGYTFVYRYDPASEAVQYRDRQSGFAAIAAIPAEIVREIADLMANPYETKELPE